MGFLCPIAMGSALSVEALLGVLLWTFSPCGSPLLASSTTRFAAREDPDKI